MYKIEYVSFTQPSSVKDECDIPKEPRTLESVCYLHDSLIPRAFAVGPALEQSGPTKCYKDCTTEYGSNL